MNPDNRRTLPPISLIGAPTDIGAGARGASMGPEALRVAGLQAALESRGLLVLDHGNLNGPANPWLPPVDGYRHLNEVVQWNQVVFDAVRGELQQGHLPILLGGDHSLGLGSISAVARHCVDTGRKLRVLWLDAHADFNTSALTPSGNVHGMPVACLCGFGPAALTELACMPGGGPALRPQHLYPRRLDLDADRALTVVHGIELDLVECRGEDRAHHVTVPDRIGENRVVDVLSVRLERADHNDLGVWLTEL